MLYKTTFQTAWSAKSDFLVPNLSQQSGYIMLESRHMSRDHIRHVGHNSLATGVLVLTALALEDGLDLDYIWHPLCFLSQIRFPLHMLKPWPTPPPMRIQ